MLLVQAILGIAAFVGIAILFSSNFRRVNWKLVGFAIAWWASSPGSDA
jgi:nucleoside permease NupC